MAERAFDVVVIGAGAPGEVIAGRLGEAGLEVAIVEERLVGGECSFYACMPSKALLRPLEARRRGAAACRASRRAGLDVDAVLARRDEVVHDLDDSVPAAVARGARRHPRPRPRPSRRRAAGRASATTSSSRGARSCVATGSSATIPPVPGLAEARPWTNIEATTAKRVPGRLFVLGGGVVGVEMAQAWSSLGSQVTLVHRGDRLIEREEPFAGAQVEDGAPRGRGRRPARRRR